MTITREQREQAESQATSIQEHLYASPEAGEQLYTIAVTHSLAEPDIYQSFAQLVGDVVLGFYQTTEIKTLLKAAFPTLDDAAIQAIELDVKKFLTPLSEGASDLTGEIQDIENSMERLESVRTMARDMGHSQDQDTTYQSNQSDLLSHRTTNTDLTRWETDTSE